MFFFLFSILGLFWILLVILSVPCSSSLFYLSFVITYISYPFFILIRSPLSPALSHWSHQFISRLFLFNDFSFLSFSLPSLFQRQVHHKLSETLLFDYRNPRTLHARTNKVPLYILDFLISRIPLKPVPGYPKSPFTHDELQQRRLLSSNNYIRIRYICPSSAMLSWITDFPVASDFTGYVKSSISRMDWIIYCLDFLFFALYNIVFDIMILIQLLP